MNQCKNKQGIKDFYLADLGKFAHTQLCERTFNKSDIKGHFLKEERKPLSLEPMDVEAGLLICIITTSPSKGAAWLQLEICRKVSHLCSKQLWRGPSEAQVDICGHLASGRGKAKPDAVG